LTANPYYHSPDSFESGSRFRWFCPERSYSIDRSFFLWEDTCLKPWQFESYFWDSPVIFKKTRAMEWMQKFLYSRGSPFSSNLTRRMSCLRFARECPMILFWRNVVHWLLVLLEMTLEHFEYRINAAERERMLFEEPYCLSTWTKIFVRNRQPLEILFHNQFLKSVSSRFLNASEVDAQ
jgi:hypothetical protein